MNDRCNNINRSSVVSIYKSESTIYIYYLFMETAPVYINQHECLLLMPRISTMSYNCLSMFVIKSIKVGVQNFDVPTLNRIFTDRQVGHFSWTYF